MRPYTTYRISGVEWLGEIPVHWDAGHAKRWFRIVNGGTPQSSVGEYWDGEVVWLTPEDLGQNQGHRIEGGRRMITVAGLQSCSASLCPQGSLVVSTRAPIGHLAITATNAATNQGCRTLVPGPQIDSAFGYYAVESARQVLESLGQGSTFMELTPTSLGSVRLPLPPLDEQRDIAAFLDRETERIDSLIAKKRLLIERLQEYRTALITRTVTRGLPPEAARAAGLDPSPRLKPSGVEWLGDVPEHWEVIPNRRLFQERDERSVDGEGELLTVSHITGVTRRSEKPDVGMFMAESLEGYKRCQPGDLVVNTMWAWMGAAGAASEEGLVSPSYNVYTPSSLLMPRFVDMAYRSARYVLGITSESRGIWTSRLRLYPQQFLTLVTAVPPIDEQEAIIRHINQIEERSQKMVESVGLAIERLQEYRAALITAAVTGKIDVRETASPDRDSAESQP